MTMIDRRSFLGTAGAVPLWLGLRGVGAWAPRGDDKTLLVLELIGGNDGLNTVIPTDDAHYARLRPQLSAARSGARALGDGTALHPALEQLDRLVHGGDATVVHGVGYDDPDRSHFRSRDIWHVADPAHRNVTASTTGWLGRTADLLAAHSAGVPAAAVGGLEVPLCLRAKRATVPSLRRVEDFQWLAADRSGPMPGDAAVRDVVAPGEREAGGDVRAFVAARAARAVALADELSQALARYRPAADYPDSELARHLQLTAQLVATGFGTRLLHVGFGGFDTHARQLPAHAALLRTLDAALAAFVADLRAQEKLDDVVVLVHSEFGRRAAENASQGTDHGAAGPVFVIGGGGRGGTLGDGPDLGALVDGDVPATTDFRRVYRDALTWLGVEPRDVLGGEFASAGLFVG